MSKDTSPVTTAMEGRGFYNRNSAMQAAGIAALIPLWENAAKTVPIGSENIAIADYGSSQGLNSMEPMRIAIEILRARTDRDRAVEVIHTDLPSNDFTALFQALQNDPTSYLTGSSGIFPSAIGRSYFEPILPPGRIHLGWNSWALQWMSRNPVDAPDHVFAALSNVGPVLDAVRKQLAMDWRRFLQLRSLEMRPGAKLFCLFPGGTDEKRGWIWLGGELWGAACDMGREGLLSTQEQLRITVPTAPRTPEDILAPFAGDGTFSGMRIEHWEIVRAPDPHWGPYQATGDAASLAAQWTGMMRAFSGPTIVNALDADNEREALIDELFNRFRLRIAAAPQPHEHYLAAVMVEKLSS